VVRTGSGMAHKAKSEGSNRISNKVEERDSLEEYFLTAES